MVLDFEKDKLISELKKRKPKKVLIQLAEGIKQNSIEISKEVEAMGLGTEVVFSGESAWGGCAIAVREAQDIGADLIVHFGHAEFIETPKGSPEILYMEVKDILNLDAILEKTLDKIKEFKKIGLSYSIQHRHDLDKIVKFFEDNGKEVVLSEKKGLVAYEGHIVGCQYRGLQTIEKKVDAFVIMGNQFHSMGAVLSVKKPVILIDVYNNDVRTMEGLREKILRQRIISIEKVKEAKNIGILVEIKPGQKFGSHKYIFDRLKEAGKNPIVITMDEMTPDKIMNFYNVEAFIELACPRIAIDDFAKYPRPIITFKEALVALGIKSWDEILEIGIV